MPTREQMKAENRAVIMDPRDAFNGNSPADIVERLDALVDQIFDGGGGTPTLVSSVLVTLTDAQIKALPTTPVEVVPAPGVNKFLSLVHAVMLLDNVAGAYTNLSGGVDTLINFMTGALDSLQTASSIYIESEMGDLAFPSVSPFPIFFSTPANIDSGIFAAAGPGDLLTVENRAMYITGANGLNGDFTGGNAANTLKVKVYYIVVDS